MTKKRLASSAAALAMLVARAASAQSQLTPQVDSPEWLKDRRYSEGTGVRTGDFELHPGIAAEFGYDSNDLLRTDQTDPTKVVTNGSGTQHPVIQALELRASPSLYLSTIGRQRREGDPELPPITFRAGASGTYREFFPISNPPSLGDGSNDLTKQRNFSANADGRLEILPGRPVWGALTASYQRVILPSSVSASPDNSFNQDLVNASADLAFQPGGGTLDWHVGYQFSGAFFEGQTANAIGNYVNQLYTRGRWRFRPRTALVYDATLGWASYEHPSEAYQTDGLLSSTPVRTRLGFNGLITDRFAALVSVGWGATFLNNGGLPSRQFDSVIGQAELKWFLAAQPGVSDVNELGLALSSIALGFTRDFQTSYLSNFSTIDRGYLKFQYFFAGKVVTSLEGGLAAVQYPDSFWQPGLRFSSFTDLRADAALFGEYRITGQFGINATVRYTQNFSNQFVLVAPTGPAEYFGMEWQRIEAFLGLRLFL
jgi:hypothetical protein